MNIKIVEVGPRDGLQNEAVCLSPEERVSLIRSLVEVGARHVEVGSFVSPKVVHMARTDEVVRMLGPSGEKVTYLALVPNLRGLEDALAAGVRHVALFAAASETFSHRNLGCSIETSLERFSQVAQRARAHNVTLRGYVSCVMGCPYEGEVPLKSVVHVASHMVGMGCSEISLGDTIGVGVPLRVRELFSAVETVCPVETLAAHFHNTYGQALANVYAVLERGVRIFDSSVGGLGGCPYAPGASGNVATEDLVYMLEGCGFTTGFDLEGLVGLGRELSQKLGHGVRSSLGRAWKKATPA